MDFHFNQSKLEGKKFEVQLWRFLLLTKSTRVIKFLVNEVLISPAIRIIKFVAIRELSVLLNK